MFGKRIKLFKIFGFEVGIDLSWIILAFLIAWSLSVGLFPFQFKGLSTETYWLMGIIGAVGLFLSIIFHELSHSLVARRYGMPMKGITLFIFGGVAEMSDEPTSPKAEFMMAVVGPISSIAIGLICYGIYTLGKQGGWPQPITGVVGYLAMINGLLAGFNLIPAFPLDGGRLLRSILWGIKGNIRWATRVASSIGSGFGILLIVLAVFQLFRGNFIGAMWWFLIGMFLRGAAKSSYQQLMVRDALQGEPVSRFMSDDPVTVSPSLSVKDLIEDYIYRYHFKMFPVVDDGTLVGCVSTKEVKDIRREQWGQKMIGELAADCSIDNTVAPDTDAVKALALMNRTGVSRLMVTEGDRLVGVITLKDLLKFLSLRMELEEK
ncbi:MAG: site-2 protease family protein [Deltaproteobacteria bacterium]|jgi:Zn-dependent protease/CBS domain-containing protein